MSYLEKLKEFRQSMIAENKKLRETYNNLVRESGSGEIIEEPKEECTCGKCEKCLAKTDKTNEDINTTDANVDNTATSDVQDGGTEMLKTVKEFLSNDTDSTEKQNQVTEGTTDVSNDPNMVNREDFYKNNGDDIDEHDITADDLAESVDKKEKQFFNESDILEKTTQVDENEPQDIPELTDVLSAQAVSNDQKDISTANDNPNDEVKDIPADDNTANNDNVDSTGTDLSNDGVANDMNNDVSATDDGTGDDNSADGTTDDNTATTDDNATGDMNQGDDTSTTGDNTAVDDTSTATDDNADATANDDTTADDATSGMEANVDGAVDNQTDDGVADDTTTDNPDDTQDNNQVKEGEDQDGKKIIPKLTSALEEEQEENLKKFILPDGEIDEEKEEAFLRESMENISRFVKVNRRLFMENR